jgi:hypothetical protein
MAKWTYKTLKMGEDGKATWLIAQFAFNSVEEAAKAAAAYMVAHAGKGHAVVVSLEPAAELKDQLAEHAVMLNYLKGEFASENGGSQSTWDIIHAIDPDWPNPWSVRAVESGHNPSPNISCRKITGCTEPITCRLQGRCLKLRVEC